MPTVFGIVELPVPLQIALAGAILYVVNLVLGKYLPQQNLNEIAAAITAALFAGIAAFLGLIPPEFEAVANAALQLLAVLLGLVVVVRFYTVQKHAAQG